MTEKEMLSAWFTQLQTDVCAELEKIEQEFQKKNTQQSVHQQGIGEATVFHRKTWQRQDVSQPDQNGGGGTMAILSEGAVFEKAGVNVSTVHGCFAPNFAAEIPGADQDPTFWASGVSLVIHPRNPFVPAVHMNTRRIITQKAWFGGGADLTPTFEFAEDTRDFHAAMAAACPTSELYDRYKKWCDEYFFLPHRGEARGIGGIFYDYHNTGSFDEDFAFTQKVGRAFLEIYPQLVRRRMHMPWTESDKQKQHIKRGRYAEFNLIYDRGTRFGLKTDGNVEAILMSLPPMASWPV